MIRLNNNYNSNMVSFAGIKKGLEIMPDKDAVLKKIVTTSNKLLASAAVNEVPENGKFKSFSIDYHLPSSNNMAKVTIECDSENPKTQRRVRVGVHHQDRDRLTSNYLYKGTKEEVLEYLNDEKNQNEFIESIKKLSASTDEYYSNL